MHESHQQTIRVGPAIIRIIFEGDSVELIGDYHQVDESTAPDAVLRAKLYDDFVELDREVSNYPEFNSNLGGPDTLSVERCDVRGRIDLGSDGPIHASFEAAPWPHSLESMIRIVASLALPRKNYLILHSSAVEASGAAHVFSGISGAGKSTISGLLNEHSGTEILADDLLLLSLLGGAWRLEVAPFSGKVALPTGHSAQLASLNLIEQGPTHERMRISPQSAMAQLPRHVVAYVKHPPTLNLVLNLIGELVESIPCYRLKFTKNHTVGTVLDLPCH